MREDPLAYYEDEETERFCPACGLRQEGITAFDGAHVWFKCYAREHVTDMTNEAIEQAAERRIEAAQFEAEAMADDERSYGG